MTDAPDYAGMRERAEEGQTWVKDWANGQFEPAYYDKRWPVEMWGLTEAHKSLAADVLALLADHDSLRRRWNGEKQNSEHAWAEFERVEAECDSLQARLDAAEARWQEMSHPYNKAEIDALVAAREAAEDRARVAEHLEEIARADEAAAEERIASLRAALAEAVECAQDGWAYAPPYFRDKWTSDETLSRLKALAALPVPQPSEEQADRCPTVNSLSGSRCVRDVLHLGAHVWEASRG